MSKAVVTGIGLLTPLGATVASTWDALLTGRFITDHAKVPLEFPRPLPRMSHLAIRAAREAIASSVTWKTDAHTALVLGTSKGPVERWLNPPSTLSDVEGPNEFGLAAPAADVARALGISGPRLTESSACASGLHALIRGAMMIAWGEAKRVLVVAAEASVHPLFLSSFNRLGVLPPEGVGCRPFDQSRQGFLMSEGAAAVCLEAQDEITNGSVIVDRHALGADATHLTGSDPNATMLGRIIAQIGETRSFDLVHAHGTGTPLNDAAELAAIERNLMPSVQLASLYSHKGALGHSLGAAGLISVVINVLSHRQGIVPPNAQTSDPMQATRVSISRHAVRRKVRRSLALAAGFGGPLAAVSLTTTDSSQDAAG